MFWVKLTQINGSQAQVVAICIALYNLAGDLTAYRLIDAAGTWDQASKQRLPCDRAGWQSVLGLQW